MRQSKDEKDLRNKKIVKAWEKASKSETPNKSMFAKKHGISARTLGRILYAAGIDGTTTTTPTKKVPTSKEVSVKETTTKEVAETTTEPAKKEETVETKEEPTVVSWTVDSKQFISILMSDGESLVAQKDHEKYSDIVQALIQGDYENALTMISVKKQFESLKIGAFTIEEHQLLFNGKAVRNDLVTEIINLFKRGEPVKHLLNFLEKLMKNPSENVFKGLWKLISQADVKIAEDGAVICYKTVRDNYMDAHSGTIYNGVGTEVTMRRTEVVEDPNQLCTAGLHVCALHYIKECFGQRGKLLEVHVQPQDFVSIPKDYKFTKARTCGYKVVADVTDQNLI